MPPASTSLIFTWSVESVLLGLIAFTIVSDYLTLSQFVLSVITAVLHLVLLASGWDWHSEASTSYLCAVSSLLLGALLRPLDAIAHILTLSFLVVAEFAAIGMVFASDTGPTWLFIHPRGFYALPTCIFLQTHGDFEGPTLALALALAWVAINTAPWDSVSFLLSSILSCCVFCAWFDMPVQAVVLGVVLFLSVVWLIESRFRKDLHSPSSPWIEVTLLLVNVSVCFAIAIRQSVVGMPDAWLAILVPVALNVVWMVVVLRNRPVLQTLPETEVRPAQLTQSSVGISSLHQVPAGRSIKWPRLKDV